MNIDGHYAKLLQSFIGDDPKRPVLAGIRIEPHPVAGAYMVATTGQRLGLFYDAMAEAVQPVTILLPAPLTRACKKGSRITLSGTQAALSPDVVYTFTVPEGDFPDWRKLIFAEPETSHGCMMVRDLDAFMLGDRKTGSLRCFGHDKALLVKHSEHPTFLGLSMEPYHEFKTGLPGWYG